MLEGKVIFIQGALPGEVVSYVTHQKKPNYEVAHVTWNNQACAAARHAALPPLQHLRRLQHAAPRRASAGRGKAARAGRQSVAYR